VDDARSASSSVRFPISRALDSRTAVGAALSDESDPLKAGSLALRLIETADPPAQASLALSTELTPEGVGRLSYSELIRVAEAWNLTPPEASEAALDGSHGLPRPV
jgi:hypothetical protein